MLEINPSQAFGSGQHETTLMCLDALSEYLRYGDKIADIGCGSGILALSALLLGAKEAAAVDIDEKAVEITINNAARNGLSTKIRVLRSNLMDDLDDVYDLIVANLVADIIIGALSDFYHKLTKGGIVILSGIILERGDEVARALVKSGFNIIARLEEGEWLTFVGRKYQGGNGDA